MRNGWLTKLFGKTTSRRLTIRDLIGKEAVIGKQLFGTVPEGHEREFFYLGNHSWVWHESWRDERGKPVSVSTRYEVHPDRVIKIQNGQPNRIVEANELKTLHQAVRWYRHLVGQQIYGHAA